MVQINKIASTVMGVALTFSLASCNDVERSASDKQRNFSTYLKFKETRKDILGGSECHRLVVLFTGNDKVNKLKKDWVENGDLHPDAKPGCSKSIWWGW